MLTGGPVGRLRCVGGARFAVHVELFARREVAIVPPRIGIARSGCSYPLRTTTPTGVVDVARAGRWTLGDLFRVWGQRLGTSRAALVQGPRLGVRRRPPTARRSALARAHPARRDRARGRRLRDAASQLPVPERSLMNRRASSPSACRWSRCSRAAAARPSPTAGRRSSRRRSTSSSTSSPPARSSPGKPTVVSFVIQQPNGKPLTQFKRGPGPHTGVHLIIVRRDLATIVHQHPPIAANGTISETVTFTEPGPYRVVVDVYPATGPLPNFQLFATLHGRREVRAAEAAAVLSRRSTTGGYTVHAARPAEPARDPGGLPDGHGRRTRTASRRSSRRGSARSRTRSSSGRGSLDYFHTHVCARGATGCTSLLGGTAVTGSSTTPGKLKVGVLVPVARHVAAVPPVQGRRSHPDRALHADGQTMNPFSKE